MRPKFADLPRLLLTASLALWSCSGSWAQVSNDADTWSAHIEGLLPLGEKFRKQLALPNDALLEQEVYRHMYLIVSQGYGGLVYQDPDYPDFWPQFSTMYNYAVSNADNTYYTTPINPEGVYRITGFRGSAHMVDFQVGSEQFFHTGLGKLGPPLSNYDIDHDITVHSDKSFEFVLSGERPSGYDGDWLPLKPKATHLFVRQVFYDWENEVTGRFSIERLDVPAIRPRDTAEQITSRLGKIAAVTNNWLQFSLDLTANLKRQGIVNKMAVRDFSDAGGVPTQTYLDGLYHLGEDEALIVEFHIPKDCFYWSMVVYDELWAIVDWMHRQSSINGHSAVLDDDGMARLVISAKDPRVPNWLDTAGYERGGLFGRFNRCPGAFNPNFKKVRFDTLRDHLPTETPYVSGAQRDATIRARRRAIQLRRRW